MRQIQGWWHRLAVCLGGAGLLLYLGLGVMQVAGETAVPDTPVFTIWYGTNQTYGTIGNPQPWINILGNVTDTDGIQTLVYSLNGGSSNSLSIGPDSRRLARPGDFNIELDYNDLVSGTNQVVITATDTLNNIATQVVTVNYQTGNIWPRTYTANWSAVTSILEAAQVVDGKWKLESGAVRPEVLDYDRLIAIGDLTWTEYEVLVPITIHAIDTSDDAFNSPSNGPGVGLLVRWIGHGGFGQPKTGWNKQLGMLGWYHWTSTSTARMEMVGYGGKRGETGNKELTMGETYYFKLSVQNGLTSTYRLKIWSVDEPEPPHWDLTQAGNPSEPGAGSLLLVAHHVDASFGNVQVTALADITPGLTVNKAGGGTVIVTPDPPYTYGQVVTLTAVPDTDFVFQGWSGFLTGSDTTTSLTLTGNYVVTATFIENPMVYLPVILAPQN
ncbi:MAG: hypothetical protein D6706_01070 [Chloroflexi bacterium]|nr:MAG: hypothetical protein D6706_01070 [Chloroflexota bacterium]